jgi:hypothetical protein
LIAGIANGKTTLRLTPSRTKKNKIDLHRCSIGQKKSSLLPPCEANKGSMKYTTTSSRHPDDPPALPHCALCGLHLAEIFAGWQRCIDRGYDDLTNMDATVNQPPIKAPPGRSLRQ